MRTKLFLKIVIGLPLVIFIDYILMAILGCTSCLLGMGESFFCGTYCFLGKGLLLLSAILFGWYIYSEIKQIYQAKSHENQNTSPGMTR